MAPEIQVGPISGFPELLPEEEISLQRMMERIRRQYELFGFSPVETPAVERWNVLNAKGGIQRQIYSVGRPSDGAEEGDDSAELGLRFDLTVPLARYVAMHSEQLSFPFRRYQMQKVWRGERAQRGRFREFWQCDIDIIGRTKLDIVCDAEVASVINSVFTALGIPDFVVRISNRKITNSLLKALEVPAGKCDSVLQAIDKLGRGPQEELASALSAEGIETKAVDRILCCVTSKSLADVDSLLSSLSADTTGVQELEQVVSSAQALGVPEKRLCIDMPTIRGLDYYTGTVYETFVLGKENWGSICSGGRFDDLASLYTDQKFPGVGVSIGLSRLFDLLTTAEYLATGRQTPAWVLVTMQDRGKYLRDYLGIAGTLRRAGIPTEVFLEDVALRDQLGYASAKRIPFAVIAGGNEMDYDVVKVRDLDHRGEETVSGDELADYVKRHMCERDIR